MRRGVCNVLVVIVVALVVALVAALVAALFATAWRASKERLTLPDLVGPLAQGRPPSMASCTAPVWKKVKLGKSERCSHVFCAAACQSSNGRHCSLSNRTVKGKVVSFCCDAATMTDCRKRATSFTTAKPTPKPWASAAQIKATRQVKPVVQELIRRLDAVLAQAGQPGWGAKQPTDANKRLTARVGGTRFTRITHNVADGGKRTFTVDPANGSGTGFEVTLGGMVTAWEHNLNGALTVIQQGKDGTLSGWKSEKNGQITGIDKGKLQATVCKAAGHFQVVLGKSAACGAPHVFPSYPYEHVSKQIGSEWAGTPFDMDCGPTGYINGLNVGYDNGPKEVKFVAYSCHKGMRWDPGSGRYVDNGGGLHGRAGTHLDGSGARVMDYDTLTMQSSYENRPMLEPNGFSSLHAIALYNNHNSKFLRAMGTSKQNMFGVHGGEYVPQEHDRWIKTLSCQDALGRPAAPGKKLRINRMTGFNDNKGMRSVRIHCTEK